MLDVEGSVLVIFPDSEQLFQPGEEAFLLRRGFWSGGGSSRICYCCGGGWRCLCCFKRFGNSGRLDSLFFCCFLAFRRYSRVNSDSTEGVLGNWLLR